MTILAVNEVYGPTLQGEGKNVGMPCMFLRLAGCNLACTWCDTPYAWDWSKYDPRVEIHRMTVDQVYQILLGSGIKALVITGGEPMLQQKALYELTQRLHAEGWWTEMETAGTIKPITTEIVKQFNVSPKLVNSGNLRRKAIREEALGTLAISGRAIFKFVVEDQLDFAEVDQLVSRFDLKEVYIMPEGTEVSTLNERTQQIAREVINRGYRVTPRLHVQLWGKHRGF